MRFHTHGNRFSHEVQRGYQNTSRLGGEFEDKGFDWFDALCALVIVGLVTATVAFIYWSANP